jgi:hypothetical protein
MTEQSKRRAALTFVYLAYFGFALMVAYSLAHLAAGR